MFSKKFLFVLFAILNVINVSARRKPPNACVDDLSWTLLDYTPICTWVKDALRVRCGKKRLRWVCPDTCGACPCKDRVAWKHGKMTCKRLAKRVAKKGIDFCKTIPKAKSQCQATCAKKCQP